MMIFGMNLLPDEGLPVVVVDEEIYRLLPSSIIGTVEKFARLVWCGETLALFGRVGRRCIDTAVVDRYRGASSA